MIKKWINSIVIPWFAHGSLFKRISLLMGASLFTLTTIAQPNDEALMNVAKQAMQKYHVPAVSFVVIDGKQVVLQRALSINKNVVATPGSLFQAGSIGKTLTAYAALYLAERRVIKLNEDINSQLTAWKIPANPFTATEKVTPLNILSMTSGLAPINFAGYPTTQKQLPTLIQVLNGEKPANNPPLRVIHVPNSTFAYSGGGYEALQLLMQEATKQDFPDIIREKIFSVLNITDSLYASKLSKEWQLQAVPAFDKNGVEAPGGWRNFVAFGAGAGLWVTAPDLAKFVINLMESYDGTKCGILDPRTARLMMTRRPNTQFGIGVIVDGTGTDFNIRKAGHNPGGYQSQFMAFPALGKGVVILTNSDNGVPVIQAIIQEVAKQYHWPKFSPLTDESITSTANPAS